MKSRILESIFKSIDEINHQIEDVDSKLEKSEKTIIFGEIGLSGEIRAISQITPRLKEAEKLGFTQAIIPIIKNYSNKQKIESKIKIIQIKHLGDLIAMFPKNKN